MNILFLSLLDFSSLEAHNIYTDLVREFLNKGHQLYAISPVEKRKNQETHLIDSENLHILKLKIGNTQKTNLIEKGISTLTLESKFVEGIKKYFSDIKFDLILYSTPPITFYRAVQFVKQRDGAKTYLLLKDIFPQNAVDLGIMTKTGLKGLMYQYFRRKEKSLYQISDVIGCLSPANLEYLRMHNKELSSKLIEVCANSIQPINFAKLDKRPLKRKFKIPEEAITFIYGGNLGKPQDIRFVVQCLRKNLNMKDRYFVICGTGTDYYKLEEFFKTEKPQNMRLINGLPQQDYDKLVSACDIGLIFLDHRFTIPNFPSRLLSYMENAMPVLACTDRNTDVGHIIEQGSFGWWCESTDENKFLEIVNEICQGRDHLSKASDHARRYLEDNYTVETSYQIIMQHFEEWRT